MGGIASGIGRVFSGARRSASPTKTIGTSGTMILAGYITSNEKNPAVQGDRKYQTWSDMIANVDIIGASIRYFLNLGGKASWNSVAADDSPAAEDAADFLDDVLGDMATPWYRVVRRALMQKYYGFSIQEWTAKRRDDGKIGYLDVEPRPQATIERWDVDDSGNVLGVIQRAPSTAEELYLPRGKIVYVVDDSISDSPEGFGLLRHMTNSAVYLSRYEQLEKYGFENDLRGIPKARIPYQLLTDMVKAGNLTEAEKQLIVAPVEGFMKSHLISPEAGVALDSSTYRDRGESQTPSATPLWDMELMTGGATSQEAVARAIERLQRQIARIAGTEGLLLGGDKVGSLALSEDKSQNFAVAVSSALTELQEAFQADLVEPLMEMNGIPEDLWPTLAFEEIQYRSIAQLTSALLDLAQAGSPLMPGDPAVNVIRELAGLPPEPEVDLEALALLEGAVNANDPPPPPGAPPGGGAPPPTDPNEDDVPEGDDEAARGQ